ncbi:MAG: hypothetical protein KBS67_05615 [Bacteroidales bacterium]|nr:hypothetical protein [Candidatus Cryptobacteroides equifaecalis]
MIKVKVLTPEWSREFTADRVFLPGTLGEFEVLRNHAPIISTLTAGEIKWGTEASTELERLAVKGGVVRLKDNNMDICVEV